MDKDKIREGIRIGIVQPTTHFCAVSHEEGQAPTGMLLAHQGPNPWAKKNFANVVFWASQIPGDGARMLRTFKQWVDSRSVVRVAGFLPDLEVDPRALALAERIGFAKHGGARLYYKGT